MNVIVGDKVILQTYRRTGNKHYVAEVVQILSDAPFSENETRDMRTVHLVTILNVTILNADTGKKYKRKEQLKVFQLLSLEEFIDSKRALVKELEAYL